MRHIHTLAFAALLAFATAASADLVLENNFEQQGKWKKRLKGKGAVELVPGGVEGKCLKLTSRDQAYAYYSIELDPKPLRGKRLIMRAKVKLQDVLQGPKIYSTAKLHVGVIVNKKMQNFAQRFVGTRDWHDQVLVAQIADDADRVVLDLGIQNGTGIAWFDNLVVTDGVTEHTPISLRTVANANANGAVADCGSVRFVDPGQPDLMGVPAAEIRLGGADFYVMLPTQNRGRTCIALRGAKRPILPARIEPVAPVGAKAKRLFFLQAAIGTDASRTAPCLVYTLRYADGKQIDIPMREGTDIGELGAPKDLANWKVAWSAKEGGRAVGLGVTEWKNPRPGATIEWIRVSTPGTGAVPIVVAISLDPVKK